MFDKLHDLLVSTNTLCPFSKIKEALNPLFYSLGFKNVATFQKSVITTCQNAYRLLMSKSLDF